MMSLKSNTITKRFAQMRSSSTAQLERACAISHLGRRKSRTTIRLSGTIMPLIVFLLLVGVPFHFAEAQNSNSARPTAPKTKSKKAKKRKMPPPPASTSNNGSELAVGSWGGDHIRLVSTSTGATVELDCAHATITPQIRLDKDNCFDVQGSYIKEHAGPPRPGEQEQSYPARFKGCVCQSNLDLTITPAGRSDSSSYTLVYGRTAQLVKCL